MTPSESQIIVETGSNIITDPSTMANRRESVLRTGIEKLLQFYSYYYYGLAFNQNY
jgi:hypothetical protein